jgi:hypothetical protein
MNPISLNTDSTYIYGEDGNEGFSDTTSNMLKYRFKHLAKGDIQFKVGSKNLFASKFS